MIYVGTLLIVVGLLFLRRPTAFLVESRHRGVTTYGITPAGCAGLACTWTGIVFNVAVLLQGIA